MEDAAKRFVRRVLLIHAALLAVVVVIVVAASREIHITARQEALAQVQQRHELLATQTARGIESFYRSILDHLLLLQPAPWHGDEMPPDLQQRLAEALLEMQLQGRVSHLFIYDVHDSAAAPLGPTADDAVQRLAGDFAEWFATIRTQAVSGFVTWEEPAATLVVLPLAQDPTRLLVAAVPVRPIEQRFLDPLNQQETIWAMLLDESLSTMATSTRNTLGPRLDGADAPALAPFIERYVRPSRRGTIVIEEPFRADGKMLPPQLITAEPVIVLDKRWTLLVASDLHQVDAVLAGVLGRSLLWAAFVIASVTAILVSTAVKLIRVRLSLERVQHEMLTREVTQARQIQLAWLPPPEATAQGLDIAAFNYPASHVSGDFYNWMTLPDGRTAIIIGDVTGHGISAAFLMATTQLLTRSILQRVGDPGRCLYEINRELCCQMFSGQFVTVLIVVIDPENGELEAATAGHFPPLIGEDGQYRPIPLPPQLVLGIDADVRYRTQRYKLRPRTQLLMFTDGAVDVQAPDGRRFDLDMLRDSLTGHHPTAQAILDAALEGVNRFRGSREPADDVTLVAVQFQTSGVTVERRQKAVAA